MFGDVFNVSDDSMTIQNTTIPSTDFRGNTTSFELFNITSDDNIYNTSISTPVVIDNNNFLRNVIVIDFRQWYKFGFETQVYGFVGPVFAFLSTVINILMITAFIKRKLFTSTHILLMTIGLFDIATCLPPTALWMYFYGILQYKYYLPFDWCRVWHDFAETFPGMCHAVSVWVTVVLAIQRVIIVAFPFKAKTWCSRKLTFVGIGTSVLISAGTFCTAYFEFTYVSIPAPKEKEKHEIMYACGITVPSFIGENLIDLMHYIGIRQWVRVVVNTLIPFVTLLVIEIALVIMIRMRSFKRKEMNVTSDILRQNDNRMTKITTWCVGLFILIEIPGMLGIIFDCIYLNFKIEVVPDYVIRVMAVVINLLLIVTSNVNFVVYSCMSREFKEFLTALYFPFCIDKQKRMSILNKSQTSSGQRNTTSTFVSNNDIYNSSNGDTSANKIKAMNNKNDQSNGNITSCLKTLDGETKNKNNVNSDKLNSVSVLTNLVFGKFRSKKYTVRASDVRRPNGSFRTVDHTGGTDTAVKIGSESTFTSHNIRDFTGDDCDVDTSYDPVLGKFGTKF